LHDTPDIYQIKQTKDVPLRRDIRRYLRERGSLDVIGSPEYTPANINKKIPSEDLQFLSVFDFHWTNLFTFELETTSITPQVSATSSSDASHGSRQAGKNQRKAHSVMPKQATNIYSAGELETYRKTLFSRLNDSVRSLITLPIASR
jgi:hypothetical protein